MQYDPIRRFSFALLLLCLLSKGIFAPELYAADKVSITLSERAEIEKDRILLGDIAEIKGADSGLIQRLKQVDISRAPVSDKFRRIDHSRIRFGLKKHRIDLSAVVLQGADQCRVFRRTLHIPAGDIQRMVVDYIYKHIPWDKNKIDISQVDIPDDLRLPKGKISCRVIGPKHKDLIGTVHLPVLFVVDNKFQKKIPVTVHISLSTQVVVTTRPLARYEPITHDDVAIQEIELTGLPSQVVTRYEDVVGKRTKRKINAKTILRPDLVEFPPLVSRGKVVSIVAESDFLKITTLGEIREKGYRGQRVRVVNLDSKREIYAVVIDGDTVKVDF